MIMIADNSNNDTNNFRNLPDYERRKIYFSSLPKNISVFNLKLSGVGNNSGITTQINESIRGGVVPVFRTYISANDSTCHNLYFLTRHSKAMLSDFGGLINRDEPLLNGCYREFAEETFEYSMFIPRTHCVMLNSTITSVIFNSIINTEILKKIHNHDYFEEYNDSKTVHVEFLKAYQMISMKIWNFNNIRLLYNEHRKVKQNRGESCDEIEGIVVLSDFLKIIQTSEKYFDDWMIVRNTKSKNYGIETKSHYIGSNNYNNYTQTNNNFKIFSPIKKLIKNSSISDINKIHSHVSTYNMSEKFEKIVKNYNIDIFSKILNNSVDISNYKIVETFIGMNLHNHILYLNCIYSNEKNLLHESKWDKESPKIHIMDIMIEYFKYIIVKHETLFSQFDVYVNSETNLDINETVQVEIKIMACLIVWMSYYIEHINRINRSFLTTIFEKHTDLLKKLPNMTFKETYHWMNCLKLSSLKQTMYDINYPVEYVLGKYEHEARTETIIKQYNKEINYITNYCFYNLQKLLSVFCKKETIEKLLGY